MKIANKIELSVSIKNGRFASNLTTIKKILNAYDGCIIDVVFKKKTNKRSNRQNRYYWSVIVPIFQNSISNEWGEMFSLNEVHEFLKTNCNFKEIVNENTGEVLRKTKSTTENNTTQQEEFHEKCRQLSQSYFNVEIPLPNEELTINFK